MDLPELTRRAARARPLSDYRPGLRVAADDSMAPRAGMPRRHSYELTARAGRDFAAGFTPHYTPGEMLAMGVFSGRYLNDCTEEFPREWYAAALAQGALRPAGAAADANHFKVASRKTHGYWIAQGWIPLHPKDRDARGWFQWYCRYWLGRRVPEVDALQIARWRSFGGRHSGQIVASYARLRAAGKAPPATKAAKRAHRARQRQGLLQWAWDCYV